MISRRISAPSCPKQVFPVAADFQVEAFSNDSVIPAPRRAVPDVKREYRAVRSCTAISEDSPAARGLSRRARETHRRSSRVRKLQEESKWAGVGLHVHRPNGPGSNAFKNVAVRLPPQASFRRQTLLSVSHCLRPFFNVRFAHLRQRIQEILGLTHVRGTLHSQAPVGPLRDFATSPQGILRPLSLNSSS